MNTEKVVLGGVKYSVKKPGPRPDIKQLTNKGIVASLDFNQYFDWLKRLVEKWKDHPELLNSTYDRLNGLLLKMPDGDVIVKMTKLDPTAKETYAFDCYNVSKKPEDKVCEMQSVANTRRLARPMAVVMASHTKSVRTSSERAYYMAAAETISIIALGVKIYINLTKYRVFDDLTHTEGSRIVEVAPIIFAGKDILLECEA